jgi:hypothetical protein
MAISREVEIDRLKQKILDMDDEEFTAFLGWAIAAGDVKKYMALKRGDKPQPAPTDKGDPSK